MQDDDPEAGRCSAAQTAIRSAGAGAILTALLLAALAGRSHWRRADGRPVDQKAAAAAAEDCARSARGSEAAIGACMARRGYFSWDGV